jgi:hypothetical protein
MRVKALTGLVGVLLAAGAGFAQEPWQLEMERRIEALTRELERGRLGAVADPVYESRHGFAPAASKVYHAPQGVSLGGYGELLWQDPQGRKDDGTPSNARREADFLRAILYAGYKFSDRILFNSEIEFEHATTAGGAGARGEVSVEFAHLDFRLEDWLGVRAGMVLVPVGFINEQHEPTVFHGSRRPNVENQVIPTTWRENGAGVFGEAGAVSWRAYVLSGLQAVKDATPGVGGFSASSALRGGRSKGAKSQSEDLATVIRADWKARPGTVIGGSLYTGESGQLQSSTQPATAGLIRGRVTLWEAHAATEVRGLELRGLYARGALGDAARINDRNALTGSKSVGERFFGGYVEAAFDILSLAGSKQSLAPFVRYERYDTQQRVPAGFAKDRANSRIEYTWGLTYKPHPNTVLKADWQNLNNQAGTGVDQFNMAVGYMF